MSNTTKPLITLTALSKRLPADMHDALLGQALHLPDGEQPVFFVPEPSQWITFVSAFLKFGFPPSQYSYVLRRFATQWLANPRASKKHLPKLPWPALEWVMQQLCLESLSQTKLTQADLALQLALVAQELNEFQLEALVEGDISILAQEDGSKLHSYYYQGPKTAETFSGILKAHGYQYTDTNAGIHWLSSPHIQSEQDLAKAYWCARRFAYPLPWASLISNWQQDKALWQKIGETLPYIYEWFSSISEPKATGNFRLKIPLEIDSIFDALECFKKEHTQTPSPLMVQKSRETLWVQRPYQRLILVEGTTEAILLPMFARLYHVKYSDTAQNGNTLSLPDTLSRIRCTPAISVGGKNQMVALYQTLSREMKVPIAILLDADATTTQMQLQEILRPSDALCMITQGEMEDLYAISILCQVINQTYHPYPALTPEIYQELVSLRHPLVEDIAGLRKPDGRVEELRFIWHILKLGRFDKVELAQAIAEFLANILVSPESMENNALQWKEVLPPETEAFICKLYGFSTHQEKAGKPNA